MKATEIQIGDRLIYRGRLNVFDFRVEQVTKRKVGYHAEPCESRMHYLRLHEVEPIPLTPEILDRNGFRKFDFNNIENQHQWTWWLDTLTNVSLWCRELNDDPKDGWMIRIESPLASCCLKIEHIHQMQHALCLCNIDKEIEL